MLTSTQLEDFLTTYSIHLGRLRLMKDDPAASKMLGLLNRQLIAAQVDVDTFYSSYVWGLAILLHYLIMGVQHTAPGCRSRQSSFGS